MRTNEFLWNICEEILIQMYKEATPSLDLKPILDAHRRGEKTVASKENWFMDYYLPMRRQEEIFNEVVRKYKCNRWECEKIGVEVWLGCAPSGVKKK